MTDFQKLPNKNVYCYLKHHSTCQWQCVTGIVIMSTAVRINELRVVTGRVDDVHGTYI